MNIDNMPTEFGISGSLPSGDNNIGNVDVASLPSVTANGDLSLTYSPLGWFETVAGELLNLEKTGGAVNLSLVYIEV